MDIIFKGRHTDVLERFRRHATAKLAKIEKLDNKAIRVDVEVSAERNPRQSGRRERVELTITSAGPAIRAEAAAEDRFAALDLALAKLEARLRRAGDRRKARHGAHAAIRLAPARGRPGSDAELPAVRPGARPAVLPAAERRGCQSPAMAGPRRSRRRTEAAMLAAGLRPSPSGVVPIEMEGDGPLVVREKFHAASPMTIDQALFEMELVGHDFFLFPDDRVRPAERGLPAARLPVRRDPAGGGACATARELAPGPASAGAARPAARGGSGQVGRIGRRGRSSGGMRPATLRRSRRTLRPAHWRRARCQRTVRRTPARPAAGGAGMACSRSATVGKSSGTGSAAVRLWRAGR